MVFVSLAHHFDIPLLNPDIQPATLVVYILVTVIHIVSGLSLRDCDQLVTHGHCIIVITDTLVITELRTTRRVQLL